ncbi:hypothetical protein ACFLRX_08240 [Acidobacteriota bacterium]
MNEREIASSLLKWYKKYKRDFFWRTVSDPYQILICEILLKKTRAETVEKLLLSFFKRFPDLKKIHLSSENELQRKLKPFGLYRQRAVHLKKLAEYAKDNFLYKIPQGKSELLKFPGVGEYTASAVICFAFNQKMPIIDTNTVRIFSRLYGIKKEKGELRRDKIFIAKVDNFYYRIRIRKVKELNWALLDLGALICKPKTPQCIICPIAIHCLDSSS